MSFLLSLMLIIGPNSIYSQSCPPSNIIFTSQSQVDSFFMNCLECTEIEGSVTIEEAIDMDIWKNDNLTTLALLQRMTTVGG